MERTIALVFHCLACCNAIITGFLYNGLLEQFIAGTCVSIFIELMAIYFKINKL